MNLIEKHHIDVSCSNLDTAKHIQSEIGDVFQRDLYSKLDALLDKYTVPEKVWQIEKLKITVPNLVLSNWKNDLVNSILKQVEAFLKDNQPQVNPANSRDKQSELISKERKYQEMFIAYLIEGKLTPNAITNNLNQVFKMLSLDRDFVNLFLEKLKDSKLLNQVILRIMFNLPEKLRSELEAIFDVNKTYKTLEGFLINQPKSSLDFLRFLLWKSNLIKKDLSLTGSGNNLKFYDTHFNLSKNEILMTTEKWSSDLRTLHLDNQGLLKILSNEISKIKSDILKLKLESNTERRNSTRNDIESILEALQENRKTASTQNYNYIKNAGLVILHPFLVPLFNQLGYLEDQKWKEERFRHRAVLLLHYLVYGKSKIFENELILNKVICGVGISDTINTTWIITKEEKEKCQALLSSVIKHWSILKDTSVKTLQETFLQREAKLKTYKKEKYELIVEQQSIDVLLDHLPWGIGMVKTPWMNNYLSCLWV